MACVRLLGSVVGSTHSIPQNCRRIGAGGGAILGAIGGNAALGAAVGLAGGLIYDKVKKAEQSAYQQG
jgi:hypothetical protein